MLKNNYFCSPMHFNISCIQKQRNEHAMRNAQSFADPRGFTGVPGNQSMFQRKKWKTNSGHLVHITSAKMESTRLKRVMCECNAKHRPPKQLDKLVTTPVLV
jgi:hypothetical protein